MHPIDLHEDLFLRTHHKFELAFYQIIQLGQAILDRVAWVADSHETQIPIVHLASEPTYATPPIVPNVDWFAPQFASFTRFMRRAVIALRNSSFHFQEFYFMTRAEFE